MILRYIRLLLFFAGTLAGTQIPVVVDNYGQLVDAHLIEAQENFRGFREIADHHFAGSVDALIRHHEASSDTIFRQEGESIRRIHLRIRHLSALSNAFEMGWGSRLKQLFISGERGILDEALVSHRYVLPIAVETLVFGSVTGLLLLLVIEVMIRSARYLRRRRGRGDIAKKQGETHNSSM
ncbi:MAG: DUF2937 family protein [Sedimenticola sp.]